jgi:hypothetical protein
MGILPIILFANPSRQPPDLGFAPTSKTRNRQIDTACCFALDRSYPELRLSTNPSPLTQTHSIADRFVDNSLAA